MRKPRRGQNRGRFVRLLAISLLILGVGRAPMPRAEYHVIAHQDGTGRDCSLHEHLLRLHPVAGPDHGDHAALHWHWALPRPAEHQSPGDAGEDSEDARVPQAGGDLLVVVGPSVAHPAKAGLASAGPPSLCLACPTMSAVRAAIMAPGRTGPWGPDFPGTVARGNSLPSWLQRWTC
ncbi:MAG: hypothetical protein U0800_01040 [Isosphaeraceae bacterium]